MNAFDPREHSHRRYNPLTGEWVQVSPHRSKRPWQGQVESKEVEQRQQYDSNCYLCPGNERAGGERNPQYDSTIVFTNDFAALQADIPSGGTESGLLRSKSERGICKVICFSPRHDLTLPQMAVEEIVKVVDLWVEQYEELASHDFINYVQIFENKGSVMGCSNPHPHGQIWSQESIPVEPAKKQIHQEKYFLDEGATLLYDYWKQEVAEEERIVFQNEYMVVLVPYWAIWPFEAMIIPKRPMARITEMTKEERHAFAEAIRHLTIKYDNLFETSFPYSSGIHQAPSDGLEHKAWHWHMSFYPPLLRSASVKKFMVGYELLANAQRDITAESATQRLRDLPAVHYLEAQ